MIAMAIGCSPRLVIADEPTTALDVTVQAQILDLIDGLSAGSEMAMLLVSHDLAVIARHCGRVLVMYAGAMMERGPVEAVLREPSNPYTRAARGAAAPGRAARRAACARSPARRRLRGEPRRLPVRGPLPVHDRHLPPRRRRRSPSRRPVSRCIAPAKWGRAMSGAAAGGLCARQDLRSRERRIVCAEPAALAGVSFSSSRGVRSASSANPALANRRSRAWRCAQPTSGEVRLEGRSLFALSRRELRRCARIFR